MFIYECICLCGATLYVFKNTCYVSPKALERLQGLIQGPKKGLTDTRSAVRFCLGSGLFGSYNSN